MATLKLTLRYYSLSTPPDAPSDEHCFAYHELTASIPAKQAALVIVDAWDYHHLASHLKRTSEICRMRIAPAMAAARAVGFTIVHAPGDVVARRYPEWVRYAGETELSGTVGAEPDWPPREFRQREGPYAGLGRSVSKAIDAARRGNANRMIDPSVAPMSEDYVVSSGDQLHRLCRDRQIMYLFYCGFATNMCVPNKPYGMKEFARRGYHLTLLRDCTTAVEGHDTVESLHGTEQAVRELEFNRSFTTTSDVFIDSCRNVIAPNQASVEDEP